MTDPNLTPPPELVLQWLRKHFGPQFSMRETSALVTYADIATQAARWGADQELEACCEYMQYDDFHGFATELRAARRPKQPSLTERMLLAIDTAVADGRLSPDVATDVRRILE